MEGPPKRLQLADCIIDLRARQCLRGESRIKLTSKEVEVLAYLAGRAGEVVSREELEREVWEFRPGVRSSAVRMSMTRLRQKIELEPTKPRSLHAIRTQGWCLELATTNAVIGRGDALRDLWERIDAGAREICLLGPGGIGKTTVAREFARQWEFRRGLSVCVSDLSVAVDAESALSVLAQGLGLLLRGDDFEGDLREVCSVVEDRGPQLLILDNLEQLPDAQLRRLRSLWALATVTAVATSRRRLGWAAEISVPPMTTSEGVELFWARAREVAPDLVADSEPVRALIEGLGAIPLAIELAAARVSVLSVAELHKRLSQPLSLLRGGPGQGRHQSLEATLEWSWNLLSEDERSVLSACAVFRGGFGAADAEAVADLPGVDVVAILGRLLGASLLRQVERSTRRLELWHVVREFCEPCALEVRRRHARHFAGRANDFLASYRANGDGLKRLGDDEPNLSAALEVAIDSGDGDGAAAVALALRELYFQRGPRRAVRTTIERVVGLRVSDATKVRVFLGHSSALERTRSRARCVSIAREAVAIARELGDPELVLEATTGLARALYTNSEFAECGAILEEALDTPFAERDHVLVAQARSALSAAQALLGRNDEAIANAELAVDLIDALGHRTLSGPAWAELGLLYINANRIRDALLASIRAEAALEAAGQLEILASTLVDRGHIQIKLGDHAAAERVLLKAGEVCLAHGQVTEGGLCAVNLSELYRNQGRWREGDEVLAKGLRLLRRTGDRYGIAIGGANQALYLRCRGDLDRAIAIWEQALSELEQIGASYLLAHHLVMYGAALADADRLEAAEDALRRGRELLQGQMPANTAVCVEVAEGHLWLARNRHDPREAHLAAARRAHQQATSQVRELHCLDALVAVATLGSALDAS